MANRTPAAVVDHDNGTVTVAVTFKWNPEWALDACEVQSFVTWLHFTLIEAAADHDKIAGLDSILTWEPDREWLCGELAAPVTFNR